jgi:hypothetical protein
MELSVKGWSRSARGPSTCLKRANLHTAKVDDGIGWDDIGIRPVAGRRHPTFGQVFPIRSVKIDFGVNLDNMHGDYLTTLHLGLEDVALLYQLCFERQTVATAGLVLGRAAHSLNEMFKKQNLLAKAS